MTHALCEGCVDTDQCRYRGCYKEAFAHAPAFNREGTVTGRLRSDVPNESARPSGKTRAMMARIAAIDFENLEMRVLVCMHPAQLKALGIDPKAKDPFGANTDLVLMEQLPGVERDVSSTQFMQLYGRAARPNIWDRMRYMPAPEDDRALQTPDHIKAQIKALDIQLRNKRLPQSQRAQCTQQVKSLHAKLRGMR